MTSRLRVAVLAVVAASSLAAAPARAADPTLLVAAREDGALVRVTLTGRVATVTDVVTPAAGAYYAPTQARGRTVSYVTAVARGDTVRYDVGTVDVETGARRPLSADGRSGHLLLSPDGRTRYVVTATPDAEFLSLVRIDARGRRTTLVPAPTGRLAGTARLSGAALSPDGRTVYVGRTVSRNRTQLLAVDTTTGARREVRWTDAHDVLFDVAVSPDGKTLAVTYVSFADPTRTRVALVPAAGGAPRPFDVDSSVQTASFTADGTAVVLSAQGHPVGAGMNELWLGDVSTGLLTPIVGASDLYHAVVVR